MTKEQKEELFSIMRECFEKSIKIIRQISHNCKYYAAYNECENENRKSDTCNIVQYYLDCPYWEPLEEKDE